MRSLLPPLLLGLLLLAPAARADDAAIAQAKQRFAAGKAAYSEGRYKDAVVLFNEANSLDPHAELLYNVGQSYEKLDDVSNALRVFREYLRLLPNAGDRAVVEDKCRRFEDRLRLRGVQQVTILSSPLGATIILDDKAVGQAPWTGEISPGHHVAVLKSPGYADVVRDFQLAADRAMDVDVSLSRPADAPPGPVSPTVPAGTGAVTPPAVAGPVAQGGPPPPLPEPPPERHVAPWTYATLALGVGGLAAALGLEMARKGAESSARSDPTAIAYENDYNRMVTLQTASRVAVGAGAAVTVAVGVHGQGAENGARMLRRRVRRLRLGEVLMRRLLWAAALLVALDAVWSLAGAGCSSDLTATPPPGNDKCDAMGQCPSGYVCQGGNCVTPSGVTSTGATTTGTGGHGGKGSSVSATGTGGHAGSSGHGGMAGATSSTGMAGATSSTGTAGSTSSSTASGTGGACDAGTMTDPDNCGACGHKCPKPTQGTGTPICKDGACDVECTSDGGSAHSCPVNGGADHVCVDQDDEQYCGSSCTPCPGGKSCQGGSCQLFCLPPLSMCGGVCVDMQSDPENCGTCSNKCGGALSGGDYCNSGACKPKPLTGTTGCSSSQLQCGNSPYSCSGTDDPYHCGSCSGDCGSGGWCAMGSCASYIPASAQWECGGSNPNWCPPAGSVSIGVCTSASTCP